MGLLDTVIGAMGQGGQGGQGGDLLGAVVGMLGQGGGLGGLVSKLQQSGLGEVANSWVGTGQNLPISADQLGGVLGHDTLSNMASQLGLNQGDLLGQLTQLLPQVVDKLTPNGQLPQNDPTAGAAGGLPDLGSLAGMLGGLLKR